MCFPARHKSDLIQNGTARNVLGVIQADPELFTLPAEQGDSFHLSLPVCGEDTLFHVRSDNQGSSQRCESSIFLPSCWSMSSALAATPELWDQPARKTTTELIPQRQFSSLHLPCWIISFPGKHLREDCQWREKSHWSVARTTNVLSIL